MEELEKKESSKEEYTCFHCPKVDSCPYAWDDYNIDNECLAEK